MLWGGGELGGGGAIARGKGGAGGDERSTRFRFHLAAERELAAGGERFFAGPGRIAVLELRFGYAEQSGRHHAWHAGFAGFLERGLAGGKAGLACAGENLGGAGNTAGFDHP